MELIIAIVKTLVALVQNLQKAKQAQPQQAAAQSPLAAMLAQQQASDAATCQLATNWMAQNEAQNAAFLQQLMGTSQTFWW
jgi:hypothetical protein